MPTTTTNASIINLKETITNQSNQLNSLLSRVSELSDRVHVLTTELKRFKTVVAGDVKYLTDRVDG